MRAGFGNQPLIHHKNAVAMDNGTEPVGNHYGGAFFIFERFQYLMDMTLRKRIKAACGFIKNQYIGFTQQGARKRNPEQLRRLKEQSNAHNSQYQNIHDNRHNGL